MKVNLVEQLMVGNYFQDQFGNWLKCLNVGIKDQQFFVMDRSKFPLPDGWQAEPIKITAKILLELGLVHEGNCYCSPKGVKERSATDTGYGYISIFYNSRLERWMCAQTRVCVDYVHQVQNLHFWVTDYKLRLKGDE